MTEFQTGIEPADGCGLVRESALAGYFVPGQYGRVGVPGVTMQELPEAALHQLAAWGHTTDSVVEQACRLAGAGVAPERGSATIGDSGCVLHIEPLKWWLVGGKTGGAAGLGLEADQGFVLDISQSRTCLHLSGEHAATLLNRHLTLDLRDQSCAVNSVLSTGFHHVGVTIWRRQDGFTLFLPRSFAVSLFGLLCESAEQFGYELLETGRTPPWQPG